MYKFIVIATILAYANAGLIGAPAVATTYAAAPALAYGHAAAVPAAVTSQSSNILRSYGNLGQVSTYSKTIDTPYSSVRKSDVRVSNPGLATVAHAAAPVAYAAPAAYGYAAPALAHAGYAAPALAHAGYAAPALAHAGYAAPGLAAHAGLVGVAYSAAPAVSHLTFDGFGAHYGW
ncbi:hypothetical protein O3M35_006714 [Rhynocoris fuscipes]|uniref:Uncharacterized protein n=1 Tax=Rhynocoris fuscipes TaxID=488301 RepID=A0AAW1DEQ7_9HEMI